MKRAIFIAAIAGLSACSETPSNALVTRYKDGIVTGEYDPKQWDAESVRKNVAAINCPSKKGTGYAEEKQADGRVKFSVKCI